MTKSYPLFSMLQWWIDLLDTQSGTVAQ